MMTTLRRQAVQLIQQVPENQIQNIIQYLHALMGKAEPDRSHENKTGVSPKMKAFWELEQIVRPVPELDYEKELDVLDCKADDTIEYGIFENGSSING